MQFIPLKFSGNLALYPALTVPCHGCFFRGFVLEKSENFRNSNTSSNFHCHDTKNDTSGSRGIRHFHDLSVQDEGCAQDPPPCVLRNCCKTRRLTSSMTLGLQNEPQIFHIMPHDMDDESMTDLSVHIYIYIDGSTVVGP